MSLKDLHWTGNLTVQNLGNVAQAIYKMLSGRKYAFSSVVANMYSVPHGDLPGVLIPVPELMTSQVLSGEPRVYYDDKTDPPAFGGFHFSDTYGGWGLSTTLQGDRENKDYENPYVVLERRSIQIIHRAAAGHLLYWTIALETE